MSRATQDTAKNGNFICTGLSPSTVALSNALPVRLLLLHRSPTTPNMHCYIFGLGFCAFARHYSRNHFCFLLLRVMRCFSSPRSPSTLSGMTQLHCAGLPHSDITGSMVICTYPMLFAAYHVLLRLPEPRHPPFALCLLFFLYRIAYNIYMHTARCFVFYFFTSLLSSICQRSSFLTSLAFGDAPGICLL